MNNFGSVSPETTIDGVNGAVARSCLFYSSMWQILQGLNRKQSSDHSHNFIWSFKDSLLTS